MLRDQADECLWSNGLSFSSTARLEVGFCQGGCRYLGGMVGWVRLRMPTQVPGSRL
jgi:hypothetical protein